MPRDALPSFGEMPRDQMKLAVPANVIDDALDRDAKENLY